MGVCGILVGGDRAAEGAWLLDSHIAPSEKRRLGLLTHSRVKLERLVLDELPEHVGTTSKQERAPPRLQEGGRRRATTACAPRALFFCAAAVKKDQDDGVRCTAMCWLPHARRA